MKSKFSKQDQKTLAIWAADCATLVLPLFEKKYPRDKRPRQALAALRDWLRGKSRVGPVRQAALAAHAAARAATTDPARFAARAAAQAASVAHVATHAAGAAYYAVKAAAAAGAVRERERQRQCLPKRLHSIFKSIPDPNK